MTMLATASPPRLREVAPTREPGLRCPYCKLVSATPMGGRVYLCQNVKCPGGPEQLCQFASILVIDDEGVRLVPWREARRINERRMRNPIAALRS